MSARGNNLMVESHKGLHSGRLLACKYQTTVEVVNTDKHPRFFGNKCGSMVDCFKIKKIRKRPGFDPQMKIFKDLNIL